MCLCGYDGDLFTCLQTLKSCFFSGMFWQGHRHGDEPTRVLPAKHAYDSPHSIDPNTNSFLTFIFTLTGVGERRAMTEMLNTQTASEAIGFHA